MTEIERFVRRYSMLEAIDNIWGRNRKIKSRGIGKSRIEKFKHFEAGESNLGSSCVICMSDFKLGLKLVELDCKHVFCAECAHKWLSNHNTCPHCRQKFIDWVFFWSCNKRRIIVNLLFLWKWVTSCKMLFYLCF